MPPAIRAARVPRRAAFFCLALAALALTGCAPGPASRDARILVAGDSVLAWNGGSGASVADALERLIDEPVARTAFPGARLTDAGVVALIGRSIPDQVAPGPRAAVILNGGANDLSALCGCSGCAPALDRIVTPDGQRGLYPDLVRRILAGGAARVVVLGYYGPIRGGGGSFAGCGDDLAMLDRRMAIFAATTARVTFVDAGDVIDGSPALYAPDRTHPSPAGSARIAALLAPTLR